MLCLDRTRRWQVRNECTCRALVLREALVAVPEHAMADSLCDSSRFSTTQANIFSSRNRL